MPTFNSVAELESYVIQRMKPAVQAVQDKVHKIIQNYLYAFYGEYDPNVYVRTWQVFDSLVKTAVVRKGNGWEGEVYFDLGALNHPTVSTGKHGEEVVREWSEAKILHSVMVGATHGEKGPAGIPVWTTAMGDISPDWIQWLKQELIANGIPVK